MGILRKGLFTLLVFLCTNVYAQDIDITFPAERAVFQRNNGNATIVYIAGNFRKRMDRIEAKLVPIQGGVAIDWTPIVNQAFFGTYRGSLVVRGGWYKLMVRGVRNGQVVAESTVNRFGVGEVFLISGQSNAQGYFGRGQKRANDDRVNVVSNFSNMGTEKPIYPEFGHLESESIIAPTGQGSWYWGELGDMLANRLNVPILFLNAAWEGAELAQFEKSANGESGVNVYSQIRTRPGYPFGSMADALHYYTNMTGLRAILWHQGETDNYINTSFQSYVSSFSSLLNSVRSKTGKDISWMVARASKDPYRFYQTVIDAQNNVIQNNGNVFEGPNTDEITERTDGVHFSGVGFTKVATAWNNSMTDNFFQASSPQFGNPPLQIEPFCADPKGSAPMQLFAPLGYVSYEWSNGARTRDIKVGAGGFQGKAEDIYGNIYYSSKIIFDNSLYPVKPTIEPLGDTEFCSGKSLELRTNSDFWNYWSNGQEGQSIKVTESGKYFITHGNIYTCSFTSDEIEIKVKPTPKPVVTASGPLEICSDESLVLRASQQNNVEWSTGSTSPELTVDQPGFYTLKATSNEGCVGVSDPIEVKIKPAAIPPTIVNIGNDEICDMDSTILKVSNLQNMKWANGSVNEEIVVKNTGEYFAINENEFGCKSSSNLINIIVRPIPNQPKILANGSTEVCEGEKISLTTEDAYEYLWSTGHDSKSIELNNSNDIFLRTSNEYGCLSIPSEIKKILVLEKPQNPSIIQSGTFTLSSFFTSDTSNMNYEWRFNDNKLISQNSFIKARESGDYSVRGLKTYKISNDEVKTCASEISESIRYYLNSDFGGFSFYPNPTENGLLTIETLDDLENSVISIFNLDGKLKYTQEVDIFNAPKKIDLSFLDYGKYIIQVRNRRNKLIGKLQID